MYYVFYIPASSVAKFCGIINPSSLIFKFFFNFPCNLCQTSEKKGKGETTMQNGETSHRSSVYVRCNKIENFLTCRMSAELLNLFQAGYLNIIFLSTDPWQHEKREDWRHLLRINVEGEGKFLLLLEIKNDCSQHLAEDVLVTWTRERAT